MRYSDNLIPLMTNNTNPSGEVLYSNSPVVAGNPHTIFDKNVATAGGWNKQYENLPVGLFIGYRFEQAKIISRYTITLSASTSGNVSFEFEASNDNVAWTVLDTRTITDKGVKVVFDIANTNSYTHYRMRTTNTLPQIDYYARLLIFEMEMMDTIYEIKHFVKAANKIHIITGGVWTDTMLSEPLTQANFETSGMDTISNISEAEWAALPGDAFEIITWAENIDDKKWLNLETEPFNPIDIFDTVSIMTYSDRAADIDVKMTVTDDSKIRYLVSKDDRTSWYAFKGGLWTAVNLSNIELQGMSKEEVESITAVNWKDWFTRGHLDFAIFMESEMLEKPTLSSITVNFPNNEAPVVDAVLTPDTVHNAWVELIATITDLEGDTVQYQVHINDVQVYPKVLGEWSPELVSGHTITKAYQHPDFHLGQNEVKLVVRDSRLIEREWLGTVTVVNNNPYAVYTNTNFTLNVTIGDDDDDKIKYRILINGVQKYPAVGYSELMDTPYSMKYEWGSADLNFGQQNTIRLEVEDSFGGQSDFEFQILGTYKGYMFINDQGEYYSSDKGDILRWLEFGNVIAGQNSPSKKVVLKNLTDYNVVNTKIEANDSGLPSNISVELSESDSPFTPVSKIDIPQVLANGETKDFFVRIGTTIGRGVIDGQFSIKTNGSIV